MSMDFNNSENQSNFDLIPNNTLAKVRMSLKPGGYDDQNQGWVGGYATKNDSTGSIYLSCEFVILEGEYARVAGLIVKSDNERGFWWSPSNLVINGIVGISKPIDFALGDTNSKANYLNENNIATIIQESGFRLWGNRTLSADPKWAFLQARRTADMINDSLLKAHLWAVDRNITKTYIEDVLEGINNYLRHLKSIGAIIDGSAFINPELNTPDQIALGKITFDFDFTPPYPAEHITFRSRMVDDYLEELFSN